jgi:cytochrome c oxidase subunit 2
LLDGATIAVSIRFVNRNFRKATTLLAPTVCLVFWSLAGLAAGDVERGKTLFAVCATCHGDRAEGMQEMNAPALAGREEWYLKRQLQNFKSGARGTDSNDIYGLQMAPMAQLLQDEQAIADVAAYLASLK